MVIATLAVILLTGMVTTQDPAFQNFVAAHELAEEKVAGLLALPEIFGEFPCQLFETKRLELFSTPSRQQPPIAVIELLNPPKPPERPDCELPQVIVRRTNSNAAAETLPTDESGYEMLAAVIYERSGRWFRIALSKGSAWLERENADGFVAYPEALISDSFLTYLRRGWDGNVWNVPGTGPAVPAPVAWRMHTDEEIPVRITSTQVVQGQIWIRIRFENEICGKSFGNPPPLEAWLPAHRSSRTTTVWFYSRGC